MVAHTLPGTVPGLLRACTPIVYTGAHHPGHGLPLPRPRRGVVLMQTTGDVGPICALTDGWVGALRCEDLAVPLDDATGRIHAAWQARRLADAGRWRAAARLAGGAREMRGLLRACEDYSVVYWTPERLGILAACLRALAGLTEAA